LETACVHGPRSAQQTRFRAAMLNLLAFRRDMQDKLADAIRQSNPFGRPCHRDFSLPDEPLNFAASTLR
jgi:hypothetical protein